MVDLRIGLEGVAVAETKISFVNGEKGELIYRGYWIEDLVKKYCYEEVVYLLWYGKLPSADEAQEFKNTLASRRQLPSYLKEILNKLPRNLPAMAVLRTAISALQLAGGHEWPPQYLQAMDILAKAPTIIAYYYNMVNGHPEREPDVTLGHAANYLYMLHGVKPKEVFERALDGYLVLSADHDMNASSFTARVVTSTEADMICAIVAAIGALTGPLHGGAPAKVDDMLDAIKTKENIEPWLRKQLEDGTRLMGFGHRVYKTYDPRAAALKGIAEKFAKESPLFQLSLEVEKIAIPLLEEYKPGRHLYPNIEFWAAGVMRTIGMPRELYTPTFCLSRIAGWSAQIMEQAANNRLIRPSVIYVGARPDTPHHQ